MGLVGLKSLKSRVVTDGLVLRCATTGRVSTPPYPILAPLPLKSRMLNHYSQRAWVQHAVELKSMESSPGSLWAFLVDTAYTLVLVAQRSGSSSAGTSPA